jgi:FdhD protein
MKRFSRISSIFMRTGGVHSCAVCREGEVVISNDDIGRHNALDKVFGKCLLEEIRLDDKLILTSGRISSEILIKVARMGAPIIVSRCAPTDLALRLAEKVGITVIGFARAGRMNIYTHPERVILNGDR